MKNSYVKDYFTKGWSLIEKCVSGDAKFIPSIVASADIMCDTLHVRGGKILSCGNGGSMSDAMHFASELTGRYKDTRDPIAAMALSDPGAMSCIANDFGYDHVFSRQVEALGQRGDTLLAISTSGTSRNVLQAIFVAKERGMKVIALTGVNGTTDYCDVQIKVPSIETGYVQQIHIMVIHVLVELIEKNVNYYKSIAP